MESKKVMVGIHIGRDENNEILINNHQQYYWSIPDGFEEKHGEIEKGDIVLVKIRTRYKKIKHVSAMAVDVIENFENKDNLKLREVIKIVEKVKK